MPRFSEMEQQHGSLIRAMLKQRNQKGPENEGGARYSQFMTVRGGLARLPQSIAKQLPANSIRKNSPVIGIRMRSGGGWSLRVAGDSPTWLDVDGLVVATPGHTAADLLASVDPYLGADLDSIQYASCAVVSLGYHQNDIGIPLNSFAFVVPRKENRLILSCSFSSLKYPGRAPDGQVLLRIFIGGACQGGLLRLPREELLELAEREVKELMKISGLPVMRHIKIHWHSMPQYHVGHKQVVARIEDRISRLPTISLASSALHGVGIPSCIKSGRNAAKQMVEKLAAIPNVVSV
jgi:oxygen-dependent protoporphyrinogen oxidase